MFKSFAASSFLTTSISAIAAAALVAGLVVFFTTAVPPAAAAPQLETSRDQILAKGDPVSRPASGTGCSSQGWPRYEPGCQFDMRQPANAARTVRIIASR